jgi:hypothetical protein
MRCRGGVDLVLHPDDELFERVGVGTRHA